MRIAKFVGVILAVCLLCACAGGGDVQSATASPPDMSLVDLATTVYTDEALRDILQFDGTFRELDAKYPVECARSVSGSLRVAYQGNTQVALLLFDDNGGKLAGRVCNAVCARSDFDPLTRGSSLEDVQRIDPGGEYLFLYTGRNDTPRESTHCTRDGYLITIEYDSENAISGITIERI